MFMSVCFLGRLATFIILCFLFSDSRSWALTPDDLRLSIDGKSKELMEINGKIQEIQKGLEETQIQGQSLEREVKKIDHSINQLNLKIKGGEAAIDKLGFEVELLESTIDETEGKIVKKRNAVSSLLRQIQSRDSDPLFIVFLRTRNLSASLWETQQLLGLNSKLGSEIKGLRDTQVELNNDFVQLEDKKEEKEFETSSLKSRRVIVEDQKEERKGLLASTKNQEKLYEKQISDLEKKQEEIAEEI